MKFKSEIKLDSMVQNSMLKPFIPDQFFILTSI